MSQQPSTPPRTHQSTAAAAGCASRSTLLAGMSAAATASTTQVMTMPASVSHGTVVVTTSSVRRASVGVQGQQDLFRPPPHPSPGPFHSRKESRSRRHLAADPWTPPPSRLVSASIG